HYASFYRESCAFAHVLSFRRCSTTIHVACSARSCRSPGGETQVRAINNSGQVFGLAGNLSVSPFSLFLWCGVVEFLQSCLSSHRVRDTTSAQTWASASISSMIPEMCFQWQPMMLL